MISLINFVYALIWLLVSEDNFNFSYKYVQNPKTSNTKFDFIVSPNHDKLEGLNVIKSIGALHQFTKENI